MIANDVEIGSIRPFVIFFSTVISLIILSYYGLHSLWGIFHHEEPADISILPSIIPPDSENSLAPFINLPEESSNLTIPSVNASQDHFKTLQPEDELDLTELIIPTKTINITQDIPATFLASDHWPACADVIRKVRDQGSCSSCWAFASTSVMADRICIKSNGTIKTTLSAQYLISCCKDCSHENGCNGGSSEKAWNYWLGHGIVTGGDYGTNDTCMPYELPMCSHFKGDKVENLRMCTEPSPPSICTNKCTRDNYTIESSLFKGREAYHVGEVHNETEIQQEIMNGGPVETKFYFDRSFDNFKGDGLYECKENNMTDGSRIHSAKIIGWGTTNDGQPYWVCVNSYGVHWGDNGFFKIKRGINMCGVEGSVISGTPLLLDNITSTTTTTVSR